MPMGEKAPATRAEAVRELREIAHAWVDGRHTEPADLAEAALRALCAGLDTPSLLHLAALNRCERDLAPELFDRVMDELGFGHHPPEDYWEGRLALARWWASEIVGGWLDPAEGIALIFSQVAEAYGRCEELNPLIDAVSFCGGDGGPPRPPEATTAQLNHLARDLLTRIPPPAEPF
ncbi:hypothetical protein ACFVU3_11660 [Streptomyces sp. NPDC058052]|uniref:hypothetical protein n=1 Tax=Streptomyces sp. NPDC058052 TaxID=3346316 RepID=UPI0036E8016E